MDKFGEITGLNTLDFEPLFHFLLAKIFYGSTQIFAPDFQRWTYFATYGKISCQRSRQLEILHLNVKSKMLQKCSEKTGSSKL